MAGFRVITRRCPKVDQKQIDHTEYIIDVCGPYDSRARARASYTYDGLYEYRGNNVTAVPTAMSGFDLFGEDALGP